MKRLGCVLPSRLNHLKELGSALNLDPLCTLHRVPSPKFVFKPSWWTSNHGPRQRLLQYCPGAPEQGFYETILHMYTPLIAQLVKNLPAMQETPVQFLGQEDPLQYSWASETWVPLGWVDPLEKGMATHSSILAWRIPWTV